MANKTATSLRANNSNAQAKPAPAKEGHNSFNFVSSMTLSEFFELVESDIADLYVGTETHKNKTSGDEWTSAPLCNAQGVQVKTTDGGVTRVCAKPTDASADGHWFVSKAFRTPASLAGKGYAQDVVGRLLAEPVYFIVWSNRAVFGICAKSSLVKAEDYFG